jgi:hypothetical protein
LSDELQVNLKLKHQSSQTKLVGARRGHKWESTKNLNYLVIKLIAND